MRRWRVYLVGCVGMLAFSALRPAERAASVGTNPQASIVVADLTPSRLAAALVAETNRVRRANGCHPLRVLTELGQAADDQATYMALMRHAGHTNVLLGQADVLERVLRHGVRPATVAENVASLPAVVDGVPLSAATIARNLVAAWMSSPGHRANLLNRQFTHLGCAARIVTVFHGSDYAFGVQVFSTRPMEEPWQR